MSQQNGKKRVTLQDIAEHTGYSVTAVSRALRNMNDIGAQATAHIQQAAYDMGYIANQTAVALRYGRSNLITLILVNLTNPYFCILADLLQIEAQAAGYSLDIVCSRDNPQLERTLVEQAIARHSEGILLFSTQNSAPAIERVQKAGIPLVLLAGDLPGYDIDCVIPDDEQGAYLATTHLAQEGCHKLAFVSSSNTAPSFLTRKVGFLRACKHLNIAAANMRVCELPELHLLSTQMLSRHNVLTELLVELYRDGFDGLFVFCDAEAWRVMSAIAQSASLHASMFGIVGFDNIGNYLVSPTPLCSVDYSFESMAHQSISLLINRIRGNAGLVQRIVCPVNIVCHHSCKTLIGGKN